MEERTEALRLGEDSQRGSAGTGSNRKCLNLKRGLTTTALQLMRHNRNRSRDSEETSHSLLWASMEACLVQPGYSRRNLTIVELGNDCSVRSRLPTTRANASEGGCRLNSVARTAARGEDRYALSGLLEYVGIPSCGGDLVSLVAAAGVLVASNSPSLRRVAKLSATSSSSSIRIPKSLSKNATIRIRASESSCSGSSGSVTAGKEPRLLSMYSLSLGGMFVIIANSLQKTANHRAPIHCSVVSTGELGSQIAARSG
jgi:hypothetical protein